MSDKRLRVVLPIAIVVVGIIAALVMIRARPVAKKHRATVLAPLVRVQTIELQDLRLTVATQGTVTPRTEATLVSEVSGRVVEVAPSFAAGGFFEEGDVLVSIDPRDYELALVRARAVVAQARVRAEKEEAEAAVAREEWEALGNGEASLLARRELQLQEARAALASAEAGLEQAERDLERTRIRAPYAGCVRVKSVGIGQYVTRGSPVGTIFAVDVVEVRLPVPDSELAFIDLPAGHRGVAKRSSFPEVDLYADFAGERRRWKGRIVRVEGEIDPKSRMVHLVAQVNDPYGLRGAAQRSPLSVGLFVEAEIQGREVRDAVVLPRSALREGARVLVVDEESRLRLRDVEIVRRDRDRVILSSGLRAGEKVCISVLDAFTDGMKVRTLEEGEGTAAEAGKAS